MLEHDLDSVWNPQDVGGKAQHCTGRKLSAKTVSDKSAEIFLSLFIRECGPITVDAVVTQVKDYSMDCILSDMNVSKRVYVNRNEEIEKFDYMSQGGKFTLIVNWKGVPKQSQKFQLFSMVKLSLEADAKSRFEFNARLVKPESG